MTSALNAAAASRLPLRAAATLACVLALALGVATPAAGAVDDAAVAQASGFQPVGEGFVDTAPAADPAVGDVRAADTTPPTGGVAAGFGGAAADGGLGAPHGVAAGLLALVTIGLAAHRRRQRAGSA